MVLISNSSYLVNSHVSLQHKTIDLTFTLSFHCRLVDILKDSSSGSFGFKSEGSGGGGDEDEHSPPPPPKEAKDGAESSEESEGEGDTTSAKSKSRHNQDQEYEDPEDEEMIPESGEWWMILRIAEGWLFMLDSRNNVVGIV